MSDYTKGYVYDVDTMEVLQVIRATQNEINEAYENNFDQDSFGLSFQENGLIVTADTEYFTLNNGIQ